MERRPERNKFPSPFPCNFPCGFRSVFLWYHLACKFSCFPNSTRGTSLPPGHRSSSARTVDSFGGWVVIWEQRRRFWARCRSESTARVPQTDSINKKNKKHTKKCGKGFDTKCKRTRSLRTRRGWSSLAVASPRTHINSLTQLSKHKASPIQSFPIGAAKTTKIGQELKVVDFRSVFFLFLFLKTKVLMHRNNKRDEKVVFCLD